MRENEGCLDGDFCGFGLKWLKSREITRCDEKILDFLGGFNTGENPSGGFLFCSNEKLASQATIPVKPNESLMIPRSKIPVTQFEKTKKSIRKGRNFN
jgi:hypothetical protein